MAQLQKTQHNFTKMSKKTNEFVKSTSKVNTPAFEIVPVTDTSDDIKSK